MFESFDLYALSYQGQFNDERFDGLIAREMVRRDSRLCLMWNRGPALIGQMALSRGDTFDALLGDCFIVEHRATGTFKLVDFQDSDWSPSVQLARSQHFRGALYTMYNRPHVEQMFGAKAASVQPGWFLDQMPNLTRAYRDAARAVRSGRLDERLFFRGTILKHRASGDAPYQWMGKLFRETAKVLADRYPSEVDISDEKLPRSEWFLEAARHRVVLTLPGHPWCYREFELFSLGIPLIAYPWHTHVEAGAMPEAGVHYVATRDLRRETPGFALDPEEGAEAIIAAFRAARRDPVRLEQIGLAGQLWYDRELTPEAIAAGVLQFLNLDGPEWHAVQPAASALVAA